jgi:hypothetical protein
MAEQIYVGTKQGIYRVARGGDSWTVQSSGLEDQELEAVAAHPDGQQAIAGTHGAGLFKTADGGANWEAISGWQGSPYIRSVSYHPSNPQIVRVGTEPARVWCSADGGVSWTEEQGFTELPGCAEWFLPYSPRAGAVRKIIMLDGNAPAVLAAIEVGGLAGSCDNGGAWEISESIGQWDYPTGGLHPDVHSIDINPAQPDTIMAATGGGVFRSTDRGATWQHLIEDYTRGVCIKADDPKTVVVGPSRRVGQLGRVMVTRDGGDTWQDAEQGLSFPLDRMCEHIICDAQDVFAVVLDDAVYHGSFADLAWRPVGNGLPAPTCAAIVS